VSDTGTDNAGKPLAVSAWPGRQVALAAWLTGLATVHVGATALLGWEGALRHQQMEGVREAGLLPLPNGVAAATASEPIHWLVAALAYTATVGLLAVASADLISRCTRGYGRWIRWLPVGAICIAGIIGLALAPQAVWWIVIGLAFAATYSIQLQGGSQRAHSVPGLGKWVTVAAAAMLVPPVWVADAGIITDIRDGLLASRTGTALVNTYYRHALLAAEPIKSPTDRLVMTYSVDDEANALPYWLACTRDPWVLLPSGHDHPAELGLKHIRGEAVALREGGQSHTLMTPETATSVLVDYGNRSDPAGLRVVVGLGLLLGSGGVVAGVLIWLIVRIARRLRGAAMVTAVLIGAALAGGVAALGMPSASAIDGTAEQRLSAVNQGALTVKVLERLARADEALPVRAHALAEWISRIGPTQAVVERVAQAPSWYEQWHGYGALVEAGWHPALGCGKNAA